MESIARKGCSRSIYFVLWCQLFVGEMGRKRTSRIVTYAGIAVIIALVGFMVSLQVQATKNNEFKKSIDSIASDTISLTQQYQAEEGKWRAKQFDNATMISIIDTYKPKYQSLIDRAKALDTPERYVNARDLLVKSVQAEMESNDHFRINLVTGDPKEYDTSADLLTQSLGYGADYDAAMKEAG